jgi:hypothetical protein
MRMLSLCHKEPHGSSRCDGIQSLLCVPLGGITQLSYCLALRCSGQLANPQLRDWFHPREPTEVKLRLCCNARVAEHYLRRTVLNLQQVQLKFQ